MRFRQRAILSSLLLVCLSAPAGAGERLGVVFMHGKEGTPAQFERLAASLVEAGMLVERPEMCWSRKRIYDRPYLDCLTDADAAVAKLKAAGATAFVIAGMSLGGNAALAYGARRAGLKGVIALAPAPPIEFVSRQPQIAKSVHAAEAMIAAGRGDQSAVFADINTGRSFEVTTTANIYLSFFGAESPGIMPDNAAHLTAPLLIVSGTQDASQRSVPYVFARAPADRLNRHVSVASDHMGTPAAAGEIVLEWLQALAAR